MKETLLACILLVDAGFIDKSEYIKHLDGLFLETSDDDLLLELERQISDYQKSKKMIVDYFSENKIDYSIFGKYLLEKLRNRYLLHDLSLELFSSKLLNIWGNLSMDISTKQPFWSMSYIGEPLTWGDVKQTRELCEKMFDYYTQPYDK